MKTILIYPPVSDPAYPPLGIASLAGFLKSKGEDVHLLDINLPSYRFLLQRKHLVRHLSQLEKRFGELDALPSLDRDEAREYIMVARSVMWGDEVIANIEHALDAISLPATYGSREKYSVFALTITRAMMMVAATHYPASWTPRTLDLCDSSANLQSIIKAALDPRINFFLPFLKSRVSYVARCSPRIVGLSVNYYSQLAPAIAVSSLLRAVIDNVVIVFGGAFISAFQKHWSTLMRLGEFIDGLVPFEGEQPLLDLILSVREGRSITEVPGLVHFTADKCLYNEPGDPPQEFPLPDFDGLPVRNYLSPHLILPYATSRGCYWNKCTFCTHHLPYRKEHRRKPIERVIDEMKYLSGKYGASDFYLVDEALPLATATGLADAVCRDSLGWRWFSEARFEPVLDGEMIDKLAKGGCVMLLFGLESAVLRVLHLMDKGTDPTVAARVLANCTRSGIRTFPMFFIGFPGETREEAKRTVEFVESNADHITHVGFSNFRLFRGSRVFADPAAFGVTIRDGIKGDALSLHGEYDVASGMSADEAVRTVDQTMRREKIEALIELPLVTRSHLAYLPHPCKTKHPEAERTLDGEYRPQLKSGLKTLSFSYNLEMLKALYSAGHESGPQLLQQSADRQHAVYLYDFRESVALEVGEHGVALATLCNGRRTVAEILDLVGEKNRSVTADFLAGLYARRII